MASLYCPDYLLVVEVERSRVSQAQCDCDRVHHAVLRRAGYALVRFTDEAVEADPAAVVRAIRRKMIALKYR